MKTFLLVMLLVLLAVGGLVLRRDLRRTRLREAAQRIQRDVRLDTEWRAQNCGSEVIDLSRGISIMEAGALAERYRARFLSGSFGCEIPQKTDKGWCVPIVYFDREKKVERTPVSISEAPFSVGCEGFPTIESPRDLPKKKGEPVTSTNAGAGARFPITASCPAWYT